MRSLLAFVLVRLTAMVRGLCTPRVAYAVLGAIHIAAALIESPVSVRDVLVGFLYILLARGHSAPQR